MCAVRIEVDQVKSNAILSLSGERLDQRHSFRAARGRDLDLVAVQHVGAFPLLPAGISGHGATIAPPVMFEMKGYVPTRSCRAGTIGMRRMAVSRRKWASHSLNFNGHCSD